MLVNTVTEKFSNNKYLLEVHNGADLVFSQSSFSQTHKIGNNGITGFTTWKQKIQQQWVTPVSIEPRASAIWI